MYINRSPEEMWSGALNIEIAAQHLNNTIYRAKVAIDWINAHRKGVERWELETEFADYLEDLRFINTRMECVDSLPKVIAAQYLDHCVSDISADNNAARNKARGDVTKSMHEWLVCRDYTPIIEELQVAIKAGHFNTARLEMIAEANLLATNIMGTYNGAKIMLQKLRSQPDGK